ncbi:MAG TPA: hypothetical protein VGL68_09190 [Solirubrobacteraceae bacterium]|jgi:hypothetical protein
MARRSFSIIDGKLSSERLRVRRPHGAVGVVVCHRLLDAHIHIALTIRQVGKLMRAIDQLGRNRLRMTLLYTLKN